MLVDVCYLIMKEIAELDYKYYIKKYNKMY